MNLTSDFRNAMAQLGSAITIITTDGPAGRFGFTASAVCSVTDSPPTLLVCMNRSSFAHGKFQHNGVLCVSNCPGFSPTAKSALKNASCTTNGWRWRPVRRRWLPPWRTATASLPTAMKWAATAYFIARSNRSASATPATGWSGLIASSIPLAWRRAVKFHHNHKNPADPSPGASRRRLIHLHWS